MRLTCSLCLVFSLLSLSVPANAYDYTIRAKQKLRAGPGARQRVVQILDHNQTITVLERGTRWLKIRTVAGKEGYLPSFSVSDLWVKALKKERKLFLMQGSKAIKSYSMALSKANPLGDKRRLGDSATPEGRFYISEMDRAPKAERYGARSMRLSYPHLGAARRGLAKGLIKYSTYKGIVRAIKNGRTPNQRTKLGSSIRIHGGGGSGDWTLGCLALNDADVTELFSRAKVGMRVEIYKSARAAEEIKDAGRIARGVLEGAKMQLKDPALYSRKAMSLLRIDFPLGDIPQGHAVCTDIVIRALRRVQIDLQALVHEDVLTHPKRYRRQVRRPNTHIDHRRARTLQVWLKHHSRSLAIPISKENQKHYQAGDIVTMDTGIANGTIYDHIGIVDSRKSEKGMPLVINIWTTGYRTQSMELLGTDYPTIVGHFRLTHPFDYSL